MSDTMIGLYGGSGPHWQTREVSVPVPGPGQVLVRARAAPLNNADVGMLEQTDADYLAGFEFAGEVVAGFEPGQSVLITDQIGREGRDADRRRG